MYIRHEANEEPYCKGPSLLVTAVEPRSGHMRMKDTFEMRTTHVLNFRVSIIHLEKNFSCL